MASADPDATASAQGAPAPTLTRGFLFSDLRGYTAFVESRGAAAGAELLDRYRVMVREAVVRYRGAEIKTEGDSFYVVFSSVSGAVACALEIVRTAAEASSQAGDAPIRVGIGVNAGETVETPEGYVGSAVNLAARLCSAAAAGEVLVSQTVRDLTANTADVRFEPAGRRHLKGIAEPVVVHRAVAADTPVSRKRPSPLRSRAWLLGAAGAVVVGGIVVALIASGTVARLVGSAPVTPSVVPSASASSAPVITDIAIPTFVEGEPDPTPVPLTSGMYRLTAFRPRTTFTITAPGWQAIEDAADTFELDPAGGGYVIGAVIQVVSTGPCITSPTRLLDPTAHGLVEWLQSTSYVKASDPTPVTAGGYAGLSLEISQAGPPPEGCGDGRGGVSLFRVGDHVFFLRPNERVLVVALDVGRQPVTLLVGAQDQATYDAIVPAARRIIQSIVLAP